MTARIGIPVGSVLIKLGFSSAPELDFEGLSALYKAWCTHVPVDNIQKMIALRSQRSGYLPGIDPVEFYDAWLTEGTGGTCLAASNAFYEFLQGLGFETYRGTASLWGGDQENHAVILVHIDGQDWLLDVTMRSLHPLPIVPGHIHVQQDSIHHFEIDPEGESFYVWAQCPPFKTHVVYKLRDRSVPERVYGVLYEQSREFSLFNDRLYVRHDQPGWQVTIVGNHKFEQTPIGLVHEELTRGELLAELTGQLGYSSNVINRWVASGALDDSMKPWEPKGHPIVDRTQPTKR